MFDYVQNSLTLKELFKELHLIGVETFISLEVLGDVSSQVSHLTINLWDIVEAFVFVYSL